MPEEGARGFGRRRWQRRDFLPSFSSCWAAAETGRPRGPLQIPPLPHPLLPLQPSRLSKAVKRFNEYLRTIF